MLWDAVLLWLSWFSWLLSLGILAAVAIPRLAATRDDAKDAKVRANVATCLQDVISSYTATGNLNSGTRACHIKRCFR